MSTRSYSRRRDQIDTVHAADVNALQAAIEEISVIAAEGDLLIGGVAGAEDRLPVGTTGGRLEATTTGPQYVWQNRISLLNPEYGIQLEANPSGDYSAELQAMIDDLAAAGGGVIEAPAAGAMGIASGVYMKEAVAIITDNRPNIGSSVTDHEGFVIKWTGAASGLDTAMIHIGTPSQTDSVRDVVLSGILLDGQDAAGLDGYRIGSNTATNPAYLTTRFLIEKFAITNVDVGIRWGSSLVGAEQCDSSTVRHGVIQATNVHGIYIDASNAADFSTIEDVQLLTCAPTGEPYIYCKRAGALTGCNLVGGGDGTNLRDFIWIESHNGITLEECQSEKMYRFVRVFNFNNYVAALRLKNCRLDDAVHIESNAIVHSLSSKIADEILLSGTSARWHAINDILEVSAGGRVTKTGASAVYHNDESQQDTTARRWSEGDEFATAASTGSSPTGTTTAMAGGRVATRWAIGVVRTGAQAKNWEPSKVYVAGDKVTPSWGNNVRYVCTVGGTSGATEPKFKTQATQHPDGTVTWAIDAAISAGTYIEPKIWNGAVYKLVTDGISHATTEPTWPALGSRATVTDGTAVWQESGPASLLYPSIKRYEDWGSAAPTSGYFPRAAIRWHNAPDLGRPLGWLCVAAGNPGTWVAFGHPQRITAMTSTPLAMAAQDLIVDVRTTTIGGASAITLPSSPENTTYQILDSQGTANTRNITISPSSGTISGAATYVINTAYGAVTLLRANATWIVIASK